MAATRADWLRLSKAQLGISEQPPGSNRVKYSEWFGVIGPWCAMELSWLLYSLGFRFTGAQTPKGWASAELMHQYFVKKGWMTSHPQPGDVVFYHFPGEHAGANHVGGFLSFPTATTVKSRDGNTSGTNPRDGGMVADMTRSRSYVIGYGRVPFAVTTTPPATTKPATWWVRTIMLTSPFMHGSDVLGAQKRLKAWGFYKGALDGIYGTESANATYAFQKAKGLKPDKIIGPTTAHALGG